MNHIATHTFSSSPGARIKKAFGDGGLIIALIVLILLFSLLRPEAFFSVANFGSILQASSPIAFISLAFLLPLIVGHFDLSVAATGAFSGMLAAKLLSDGVVAHWAFALLFVLMMAALVGLVNGVLVAYVGLNSLVVTLGTQVVLFGLNLWYSEGAVVYDGIPADFIFLGQGRPAGIPVPFIIVLVAGVLLWWAYYYTPLGRRFYAIGGNEDAARLSGIRVKPLVIMSFIAGACLAGIGGFLQTAQVGSASPGNGNEFLLPAIAACFLGETSIRRGFYNVWGTVVAVYLVAIGTTGLFMLGASNWVQPVFHGGVLLGAVLLARWTDLRGKREVSEAQSAAVEETIDELQPMRN